MEHFDVVIVGAGLSGVGAGCRLQVRCPGKKYVILEARKEIGGTWDLFRYPGVRSDSDMFTLGYPFRPWKEARAIADGPSILKYVRETAQEFGIDQHIRFQQRVESASWSSQEARWRVEVRTGAGEKAQYSCDFLYGCTGYYRYEAGYEPSFPGAERFRGQIVHPQRWPEDLDYAGKKVLVIGSGATAVTLVPAMAGTAAHVTMLQRSPTYILSLPNHDPLAKMMRRWLPGRVAQRAVRWKNILISMGIYQLARHAPQQARRMFREGAVRSLPAGYEVDKHFNPRYQPWDQRLCLVPDSDLFKAISSGKASVVTDQIETFTERGVRLQSGQELEVDIIVTATGLQMLALGAVKLTVDGTPVEPGAAFIYKGTMLSNVPNFAFCIGYTNASWTLRADLASTFVCRVLNYMDRHGYRTCMPECDTRSLDPHPLLSLNLGYVMRAAADLPKQASKKPWVIRQNYILDMMMMKLGRLQDGILKFGVGAAAAAPNICEEIESVSAGDD
ncbi:MAG TPA: NAD(P)/FAD-dependent oxidoreductase [Candidatus Sulfotelmatobacter sp.]|nr:NAD(P)/FAD-dependent oxidoreductase [Candidatus Sulfotelmatobacter sp.]